MKPSPSCGHSCLRSRRPGICLSQGPHYNFHSLFLSVIEPNHTPARGPAPRESQSRGHPHAVERASLQDTHAGRLQNGAGPRPGGRGPRKARSLGECREHRHGIMGKPGDWEAWGAWLWGVRGRPARTQTGHAGVPPTPNIRVDHVYGVAGVRAFGKGSPHIPAEGRVSAG